MKKVAAVVVTYNRKELLKECISALLHQSYRNLDILIIDNASTDGTETMVTQHFGSAVKYHNTGTNLGGAGGFQYGVKKAALMQYDYLWLMDDDTIPSSNALDNLVKTAETIGNFGFLSGKVLWKDNTMCRMNIPKTSINRKLGDFNGSPKKIIAGTFVSFFVPTRVVRGVGLPIKEFFIWADDIEYSRRISRLYNCYFVPDSIVIHKCKSNNGSNIVTDTPKRFNRYRYAYRNEIYVYRREGISGWLHLVLKTFYHSIKVLAQSPNYKVERLSIIWSSTIKGLKFNPSIETLK